MQVRTREEAEKQEEDEGQIEDVSEETAIHIDQSLIDAVDQENRGYTDCDEVARQLAFVYRQEIFEILNLYGLSHESDLWCRNSSAGTSGELEDTAYTELEQLVTRTRSRFFFQQISHCETDRCDEDTPTSDLCNTCRKRQRAIVVACYRICYSGTQTSEQAPILSLPWLFAAPLLVDRKEQKMASSNDLLITAMSKVLDHLVMIKRQLRFDGDCLRFKTSQRPHIGMAKVDMSVFAFIEVLQGSIGSRDYPRWPYILSRFVHSTPSFKISKAQTEPNDNWELISQVHDIDVHSEYVALLISAMQPEADQLMHNYFQSILDICFEEGCRTNDADFLKLSENILLLLQKMAIKETII